MPTPLELAELYKKVLVTALKLSPSKQAKKILGVIGEGNLTSDNDLPESLRNRYSDTINDSPSDDSNQDFEAQEKQQNDVYQKPQVIYQTNVFNIQNSDLPSKPGSLLPIQDGVEGDGQTPTAISIGAPISLAASVDNQQFGKLLYSPFSSEKLKIRQVNQSSASSRLAELNELGIENFAKYLAKDETADVLDAVCLFVPSILRGLSGETSVLFGKDTIKFLLSNFSASSVNALIGVNSSINQGYEIESIDADFIEDSEAIENISMGSFDSALSEKIYQILGGDNWIETEQGNLAMSVQPERLFETVGNVYYTENTASLANLTVTNLLELMTAYGAVDYFRSGHHRLPAMVPTSLRNTPEGNVPLQIYDAISFQEWMLGQIDGLVGEFPLQLRFKTVDEKGKEKEECICIENISEAIAEIIPILINVADDSDTAINIGMKTLVEAMKATNTALTTYDYAVANAEYLGYKGNEKEREIDLTFTPGAANIREALKPSKKKIVGWINEDNDTLIEILKKTLIATEIVKASLFHPFTPGDKVTGDAIREDAEAQKTADDASWEQFKQRVNNPTGRYEVPKPKAKVKDLTVDNPASEA